MSTIHSKVETESSPTAAPNRDASSSIVSSVTTSSFSTSASVVSPAAATASAASSSDSRVTDTSNSFCSCICSEQSRPPSVIHQSPLPITWISWCRVDSILSSTRTFLLSPTPEALTSCKISLTNSPVRAASPRSTIRWPLPPPPPIALRRTRLFGYLSFIPSTAS